MYCRKCGAPTMNGERQCLRCGATTDERPGPAVMTARPAHTTGASRPLSRLAACFLGLSVGALANMATAAALLAWAGRAGEGSATGWNLGLAGLALLAVGFILECTALLFGVLAGLRLRQTRRLRGRRLALAGMVVWLCGAAMFFWLRSNPHIRPPARPLVTPQSAGQGAARP